MATDARISISLPAHPKTKKLARRMGPAGPLGCIYLFLWVASNRSDGDLSGMSDEDIELSIDWSGDEGAFVRAMVEVGFLEGEEGSRSVHDWSEHNPWAAGAGARSEKSRWAGLCKKHGRAEAARQMPEYAERIGVVDQQQAETVPESASGTPLAVPDGATGTPLADSGSAPFLSVSLPYLSDTLPKECSESDSTGHTLPTMAAAVCVALKASGIGGVNPSHQGLIEMLEQGADIGSFVHAGKAAVERGKGNFGYVLAMVKGQMADAKQIAVAANSRSPPAPRETDYQRSMREKMEIVAPGIAAKRPQQQTGVINGTARRLDGSDIYEVDADVRPRLPQSLGGS